jgi:hypothetical protein
MIAFIVFRHQMRACEHGYQAHGKVRHDRD